MSYFVTNSHSSSPGGRDGEFEVLDSPIGDRTDRWSMNTKMIALCLNRDVAEHIAKLLNQSPYQKKNK